MLLATIGYEGLEADQLFEILTGNNFKYLIDVRELPLSRKQGFSKKRLSSKSLDNEIRYIHMPALGCPRKIRHDYREDKDWSQFSKRYKKHLNTQNEELHKLVEIIKDGSGCLLCVEANPNSCHRSYIVERLVELLGDKLSITHLVPISQKPIAWIEPLPV